MHRSVTSIVLASLLLACTASRKPPVDPVFPYSPGLDLTSMDKSIDPCVDFYQFACGGWQKRNPLPSDRSNWATTTKMAERNLATVRAILEKASPISSSRSALEARAGDFYYACMDTSKIEKKGLGSLG